ncbi:MAG TPA: DNA gyrase inhibitor YacG [Stellaceae bacterium]|nr:DNA gyrase inhibitor YacG [Stellaceae bacterium]
MSSGKPCPICGKPADEKRVPFCSRRCADIDLGRWLKGVYAVPTDEAPDEPPAAEQKEN